MRRRRRRSFRGRRPTRRVFGRRRSFRSRGRRSFRSRARRSFRGRRRGGAGRLRIGHRM